MINFTTDFQRKAAAIVAAIALSTTFVGAAVGPAHAVGTQVAAATVSDQAKA